MCFLLFIVLACAAAPSASAASIISHTRLFALRGGSTGAGYRLRYFDARGAAELARVALAVAGVDYEDFRYPVAMEDGKPKVPEFWEAKAAGQFVVNMGRVPVLEVLGTEYVLGQSRAIERFIARKHGLAGADDLLAAQVDALCECCRDLKEAFGRTVPPFEPEGEAKAAKRELWYKEQLPDWLNRLELALPPAANSDSWAVGDSLSIADLAIWQLMRDTFTEVDMSAAVEAASCARLSAIASAVAAMPSVAGWLQSRPQSMF